MEEEKIKTCGCDVCVVWSLEVFLKKKKKVEFGNIVEFGSFFLKKKKEKKRLMNDLCFG